MTKPVRPLVAALTVLAAAAVALPALTTASGPEPRTISVRVKTDATTSATRASSPNRVRAHCRAS